METTELSCAMSPRAHDGPQRARTRAVVEAIPFWPLTSRLPFGNASRTVTLMEAVGLLDGARRRLCRRIVLRWPLEPFEDRLSVQHRDRRPSTLRGGPVRSRGRLLDVLVAFLASGLSARRTVSVSRCCARRDVCHSETSVPCAYMRRLCLRQVRDLGAQVTGRVAAAVSCTRRQPSRVVPRRIHGEGVCL